LLEQQQQCSGGGQHQQQAGAISRLVTWQQPQLELHLPLLAKQTTAAHQLPGARAKAAETVGSAGNADADSYS
jgi:hypothetical protein